MHADIIEIITPKKFILNGLWFGPAKARRVIIYLHGLTNNAFGQHKLVVPLVDKNTALITFSNRGHDLVSKLKKQTATKKGYRSLPGGKAHEVFTECVDDIQGVVDRARQRGAREIYLAGHSTGCQKSMYYLSRPGKQKQIAGVILMAPVSDYAWMASYGDKAKLKNVEAVARRLVRQGKKHQLLPPELWPDLDDAQRFLSLYTPDSEEEIFSYAQPQKEPKTLQAVRIPLLALFAEKDEYRDRPTAQLAAWFLKHSRSKDARVVVIPHAPHNFNGSEKLVQKTIRSWLVHAH